MFDACMRVDSIRLFVSMDTVSRRALVSVKMANEEDVLVDLMLQFWNLAHVKMKPVTFRQRGDMGFVQLRLRLRRMKHVT